MDWKAEALARVRRARGLANRLVFVVGDIEYDLCKLEEYDEYRQMRNTISSIDNIIRDLFELEGKLSRP